MSLLLGAPLIVALGTFNNQWFQLNFCLPFPLLSLFALAAEDPFPFRRAAARTIAIVGPPAVMLIAFMAPYSLPGPIIDQQIPIEPPLTRGTILVDEETAAFVNAARGLASKAIIVDLSGTGPGVAILLGGGAPVLPWLNPATPAWPDVVWSRLTRRARENALFVGPVWPLFKHSTPARWLEQNRRKFCRTNLPEMPFWGEERTLEVWRPCAAATN